MPEVFFSCECGMTLTTKGDEPAGAKITCPSCQALVRVPVVKRPPVARPPIDNHEDSEPEEEEFDDESEVESSGGLNFGIVYLSLISLLTIGAVGFFLIPALTAPQTPPGQTTASNSTKEQSKKLKTNTSSKKLRKPVTTAAEPSPEETEKTEKSEPDEVVAPPVVPPADSPEPVVPPIESTPKATPPPKSVIPKTPPKTAPPKSSGTPVQSAGSSDGGPYSQFKDPKVREALRNAYKNAKVASSAYAASNFLKTAEKLSNNDPEVMAEIKKIRDLIIEVRSKAP